MSPSQAYKPAPGGYPDHSASSVPRLTWQATELDKAVAKFTSAMLLRGLSVDCVAKAQKNAVAALSSCHNAALQLELVSERVDAGGLSEFLWMAFSWSDTPEGHTYWNDVRLWLEA